MSADERGQAIDSKIGKFVHLENSLQFCPEDGSCAVWGAGSFLAFSGVSYADVAGKRFKVTVRLEEVV